MPTGGGELLRAQLLSHVWLFITPWTVAHQTPLSMGFPRQEHWSGLPCPPPGDLPDPGTEPASPTLGRWVLYYLVTWEAQFSIFLLHKYYPLL